MRPVALVPLAIAAASLGIRAQEAAPRPAPHAELAGVVYDSLGGRPLVGAEVVVSASSITALTDSTGKYRIPLDSLLEGNHTVSFFHPAIDTIGIAAPVRSVRVKHGESVMLDLAVPSPTTIIASMCADSMRTGGRGLILGDVRDGETDKAIPGAFVVVQWSALQIGNSTISRLPQALNARADADGLYRICGVPPQTPLRIQARLGSKQSGWLSISVETMGVFVQEFSLGDRPRAIGLPVATAPPSGDFANPAAAASAGAAKGALPLPATTGHSTLAGQVVGADGQPIEGALVSLVFTTVRADARSDFKGNFRLTGLPAGTQTVEVKLLSYQPKRYVVNLSPKSDKRITMVLDQRAQVLDPVVVTGNPSTDIPGFDERRKSGVGTFFTKDEIQAANSGAITDLFRKVPGLQVLFVNGQYEVLPTRRSTIECTSVQYVVDGVRYDQASLDEDMNALFQPTDIEAIEIYTSATDTPAEFAGPKASCGTIMIWTNRGHFKKKSDTPPSTTP